MFNIFDAMKNSDLGPGFPGVLLPDTLATAAGHHNFADPRSLDATEVCVFQAVILAPEA
jgi:hypothetical protein